MAGNRTYRVTYTEAIVRDAVRSYVRRRTISKQALSPGRDQRAPPAAAAFLATTAS